MRFIRFLDDRGDAIFAREADGDRAYPALDKGFPPREFAPEAVAASKRLAPVVPPNIIAIGRNYREHAAEMKATAQEAEPLIFLKATTSIIGPQEPIVLPASAPDEVDYEAELGVVIGRKGKNIPPEQAIDYVFGYTCANDISARDCQKRRDKQWARAKSFDTFCPLGPAIVTADELKPDDLRIRSYLNDRLMQDSRTSEMIFSVALLISYISRQFTLLPGTLILTGTPAGVGAARTPPLFLCPGDEVTVEIEGIGRLTNPVRHELQD